MHRHSLGEWSCRVAIESPLRNAIISNSSNERLGFRSLKLFELTPGLEAVLAGEASSGLDPAKRVAMLKQIR